MTEHRCTGGVCPVCLRVRHWDMVLVWCVASAAIVAWSGAQAWLCEHGVWWPTVASFVLACVGYAWVWRKAGRP